MFKIIVNYITIIACVPYIYLCPLRTYLKNAAKISPILNYEVKRIYVKIISIECNFVCLTEKKF
jgi:hypothetical protein